jgi:hypothetical protein
MLSRWNVCARWKVVFQCFVECPQKTCTIFRYFLSSPLMLAFLSFMQRVNYKLYCPFRTNLVMDFNFANKIKSSHSLINIMLKNLPIIFLNYETIELFSFDVWMGNIHSINSYRGKLAIWNKCLEDREIMSLRSFHSKTSIYIL